MFLSSGSPPFSHEKEALSASMANVESSLCVTVSGSSSSELRNLYKVYSVKIGALKIQLLNTR